MPTFRAVTLTPWGSRAAAHFDRCGFGAKPLQQLHPAIFFSGLKDPKRSANRISKYGLSGWIGFQDTPEEITEWRGEIRRELDATRTLEGLGKAA